MLAASIVTALGLLASAPLANAQEQGGRDLTTRGAVGFGCWASRPTQNDASVPYYQTGNAASATACVNNCAGRRPSDTSSPLFWYWQGTNQVCWCGSWYQRPQQQLSGNTPCYTGAGDTRGQWAYGRVSTTFTTFGPSACRARNSVGLANSAFSTAQVGPAGCMGQCRSFRFAYWWSDTGSNNFRCACSNDVQTGVGTTATCAGGSVFVWEHSSLAQVSALDRKKRRSAFAEQEQIELCPGGLSACALRDNRGAVIQGAFECIDTRSELESCGGCIDGTMNYNGTVTNLDAGVNCESAGVARGRSSCHEGKCIIDACRRGWQLEDGRCVRK